MNADCHACGERFAVPAGTLAARCPACGAHITLTAMRTRPVAKVPPSAAGGGANDPLLGTVLGGYRLIRFIGAGGMGAVYEAERTQQTTLEAPERVAVKVLSEAFAQDPQFVERFNREAEALTSLRHANLVRVFAKGEQRVQKTGDVRYFFIMELLEGQDLRSLTAGAALAPPAVASVIRQAAAGLAYAHRHGVVHRDVKPGNILVSGAPEDGESVKIVDFGVAQLASTAHTLTSLTRSNLILGTLNYMSPEQRMDASGIDHRADVYALAVVAYELLTGRLPLGAFEAPSELVDHVPPAVDRVLLKALQRDPERRPADVTEFAAELDRALTRRRSRIALGWGTAAILLVISAGSLAYSVFEWGGQLRMVVPVGAKADPKAVVKSLPAPRPASPQAQVNNLNQAEDPRLATPSPWLQGLADQAETALRHTLELSKAPPKKVRKKAVQKKRVNAVKKTPRLSGK